MTEILTPAKLAPAPQAQASSEPPAQRTLSADLRVLAERFNDRPVRLADVVEVLHGRGYRFLLVLLCLPFLTPIPLPGLSTLFGLVIALIGLRLALGQKPRLLGG